MADHRAIRSTVALTLALFVAGCGKSPSERQGGQTSSLNGTYKGVFLPEADNELMRLELGQAGSRIDGVLSSYGDKRYTGWKKDPQTMKVFGLITDGIVWLASEPDMPDFFVLKLKPIQTVLSGVLLDTGRSSDLDHDNNQLYDRKEFLDFFELNKASAAPIEFEKE